MKEGAHPHPDELGLVNNDVPLETRHGIYETKSGCKMYFQLHYPKDKSTVKGLLMHSHGFQDHCDYYAWRNGRVFASHCNFAVLCPDFPSHGRSDGLHGYFPDWSEFLNEIQDFVEGQGRLILEEFQKHTGKNDLKYFCFGQSMGGAVTIDLSVRCPSLFAGMILLAPLVKVADDVKPPAVVVNTLLALATVFPTAPLGYAKKTMTLCYRCSSVGKDSLANNHLHYKYMTRLGTALCIMEQAPSRVQSITSSVKTPYYLIHSKTDKLTAYALSAEFHQKTASKDKTFADTKKGCYHGVVVGEPVEDMRHYFKEMCGWLLERV